MYASRATRSRTEGMTLVRSEARQRSKSWWSLKAAVVRGFKKIRRAHLKILMYYQQQQGVASRCVTPAAAFRNHTHPLLACADSHLRSVATLDVLGLVAGTTKGELEVECDCVLTGDSHD